MRVWLWVIIGAVLPLALGATFGSMTTTAGEGTWAYPSIPIAFLLLSVGLAASHLLVGLGYLVIARRTTGWAAPMAWLAFAGSVGLAVCEVWSGLSADLVLGSPTLMVLAVAYMLTGSLVVVGSIGAGFALIRARAAMSPPLLAIGVGLAIAMACRLLADDFVAVIALTLWSLLYVWLAFPLRSLEAQVRDTNVQTEHSSKVDPSAESELHR